MQFCDSKETDPRIFVINSNYYSITTVMIAIYYHPFYHVVAVEVID